MNTTMRFCTTLLVLCFSGVALGNNTVTRILSINPFGTYIKEASGTGMSIYFGTGNGSKGGLGGIAMPDPNGRRSDFSFGFTIPDDYAPGTTLHLRIVWRSDTTSCVVNLRNDFLHVSQPGKESIAGTFSRLDTMQAPDSTKIANETFYQLIFDSDPGLKAGDPINGGLFRSEVGDTCASLIFVHGIAISYEGLLEGVFANGFER